MKTRLAWSSRCDATLVAALTLSLAPSLSALPARAQAGGAAVAKPAQAAPPAAAPGASGPAAATPSTAAPTAGKHASAGGALPALLVAQAQFRDKLAPDGSKLPEPGAAKLTIVRATPGGWQISVLEDPDSNVFHKALPWDGGLLTIGATRAMLKTWRSDGSKWVSETRWSPVFGGKFDRLRDLEHADVDRDGKEDLVIATHDQGVIAIVRPARQWAVEEIAREPNIFVHEIELGDVDGDGQKEIFATPSKPNTLEKEQPGEVRMYRRSADGKSWQRSMVDAPGDTHAKEILTADADRDGKDELYIVWEGAIGKGGALTRPVTVKQYRMQDGQWVSQVVATVPDRQMRSIAAGDVNGDGKIDLVAGGLGSGLWMFEQQGEGAWKATRIDERSSGFEHPVLVADLDGDGAPEIYVAAEDQGELRRYRWRDGKLEKQVVAPLKKGDITWNLTAGAM